MEKFLTFKEDKIPITVFINCIDTRRQAPPEVSNLHGVSIHHPVVSHSPKPLVLQTKQKHLSTNMQASMAFPCAISDPSQTKLLSFSLSHIKTVKEIKLINLLTVITIVFVANHLISDPYNVIKR